MRLGAFLVVWGQALAYRGETEIQPSFTLIPPGVRPRERQTPELMEARRGQHGMLLEQQAQAFVITERPANQIELRKTSAQGVADRVLLLAGRHVLQHEQDPSKALRILERAPRTPEAIRLQAQALFAQRSDQSAFAALREALALDPNDRPSQALLGDLYQVAGRFAEALTAYCDIQRASATPQQAQRLTELFWHIDVTELLPRLQCPVLVMHARRDDLVPFTQGQLLAQRITGARSNTRLIAARIKE